MPFGSARSTRCWTPQPAGCTPPTQTEPAEIDRRYCPCRRTHVRLDWLVGRDDHTGGSSAAAEEPQLDDLVVVIEQALAGAEHERVDHQQVFVDQPVREQRADQLA